MDFPRLGIHPKTHNSQIVKVDKREPQICVLSHLTERKKETPKF